MLDPKKNAAKPLPGPDDEAEPVSPESAVRMLREMSADGKVADEPLVHEAPSLIGRSLGQYRVVSKVGQGGMGAVFKAEDMALSREVALKVLWTGPLEDPRVAERFLREARCLARLSHPNLLHVYNVGSEGDVKYFAMELLPGQTLSDRLRRGTLKVPEALSMAGQMLSALDYVHRQGITHRDIKSGNIMLCGSRVVLMDFGLAKDEHTSGLTSEGVVLGTPEYMTPEQADGRACGPPTDIYSLGIVLFEALTGQVPFTGRSALSIIRQHLDQPPPSLASRLPGVDPQLDRAIARCMAKDPQQRFPDCAAMAEALVRIHKTPELIQLAATRTAGDTLVVQKNALPPTMCLPPETSSPTPVRRTWLWLAAGFLIILLMGVLAIRVLRKGPASNWGQVVRVESGPSRGRTLRWEFVSQGAEPKNWTHRVEMMNEDGTWGAPRLLTHEEFKKEFPRISLRSTEGSAAP